MGRKRRNNKLLRSIGELYMADDWSGRNAPKAHARRPTGREQAATGRVGRWEPGVSAFIRASGRSRYLCLRSSTCLLPIYRRCSVVDERYNVQVFNVHRACCLLQTEGAAAAAVNETWFIHRLYDRHGLQFAAQVEKRYHRNQAVRTTTSVAHVL